MGKEIIIEVLKKTLNPLGFIKEGSNFLLKSDELIKIINLQKSSHSNAYYINYGFIIKSIPLENEYMHVQNRLHVSNNSEDNLLDLENNIPDSERKSKLVQIVTAVVEENILPINTELELYETLINRVTLNDISLAVKAHFKIKDSI